jgi:hypothetical protein
MTEEIMLTDFQKYVINVLVDAVGQFADGIQCSIEEDGRLLIEIGVIDRRNHERS